VERAQRVRVVQLGLHAGLVELADRPWYGVPVLKPASSASAVELLGVRMRTSPLSVPAWAIPISRRSR
jgi:hypothetical protein